MSTCQWNGVSCENALNCYEHIVYGDKDIDKINICKGLTTSDNSERQCGFTPGIFNNCKPRLCSGKTDAVYIFDCIIYMPSCRYVGVGTCVDS